MRFVLGLLLDYCIRGKKPLLEATLSVVRDQSYCS